MATDPRDQQPRAAPAFCTRREVHAVRKEQKLLSAAMNQQAGSNRDWETLNWFHLCSGPRPAPAPPSSGSFAAEPTGAPTALLLRVATKIPVASFTISKSKEIFSCLSHENIFQEAAGRVCGAHQAPDQHRLLMTGQIPHKSTLVSEPTSPNLAPLGMKAS